MSAEIGRRIKEHREAHNMTQEELGKCLGGIGKAAVQKIEAGKTGVDAGKLKLLCETFRVLPSAFLYDSFHEFWERVFRLKLEDNEPYLKDMEKLSMITAMAEERFGSKGLNLLHNIDSLNEDGVERALSYVGDLTKIDDYQKSGRPN